MKSSESFKPFTINAQPDTNPSEVKKHPNIPNINGSGRQTQKNFDLSDITAHPAKKTIDFSKANNPDDYTQKIQEHQREYYQRKQEISHRKHETIDLAEKARETRKRRRHFGQKILATFLVATTAATVANGIKRERKDPKNIETSNINIETHTNDSAIENQNMTFDDATNEVTIHQAETNDDLKEAPVVIDRDDYDLELTPYMQKELERAYNEFQENKHLFEEIAEGFEKETGEAIAPEVIASICYRENGFINDSKHDYYWKETYLHNGESLGKTTTKVPEGVFFEKGEFVKAGIDALKKTYYENFRFRTEGFGITGKSLATSFDAMALFTLCHNGVVKHSSYMHSGTTKQTVGKYVADNIYDPNKKDANPGTIALLIYFFAKESSPKISETANGEYAMQFKDMANKIIKIIVPNKPEAN